MSDNAMKPLLPGASLGMLGGGQLGRMFTVEALRMGYSVTVLDPDPSSPAGQIATRHLHAPFDDPVALAELGRCDAVSLEFENVPVVALQQLAETTRVAPAASAIRISQDRILEKTFASDHGVATVAFAAIDSSAGIAPAVTQVGLPAILKTARLGYDGKGQVVCHTEAEVEEAFASLSQVACVLEQRIELAAELSVVLARGDAGDVVSFPVAENQHRNGILDVSIVPARVAAAVCAEAERLATVIANALEYVGVMAVEFFIDADNRVIMNEIAPRPHNSGHYTLNATVSSQFEQQVRMLCGLPAASVDLLTPVVMLNLLGDSWFSDADNDSLAPATAIPPDWFRLHQIPGASLHLYGKHEPRPGRKMGHVNVIDVNLDSALQKTFDLRAFLQK